MNSNLDPHIQLEEWLVDGAVNDPPREMAFHASMCDECLSRLNAFDSLAKVDVGAAGSPPPLAAPTRVVVGLAWARLATAAVGGILALASWSWPARASSSVSWVMRTNRMPPSSPWPAPPRCRPMADRSAPLGRARPPSQVPAKVLPRRRFRRSSRCPPWHPNAAPLALPNPPSVTVKSVSQTSITIRWTPSGYGGPVQKWEIWRSKGGGAWSKHRRARGRSPRVRQRRPPVEHGLPLPTAGGEHERPERLLEHRQPEDHGADADTDAAPTIGPTRRRLDRRATTSPITTVTDSRPTTR